MKNLLRILSFGLVVALCFTVVACAVPKETVSNTVDNGNKTNGVTFFDSTNNASTNQTVSMESKTDSFTLSEITYGAEEKFVYTATVSFENGVAVLPSARRTALTIGSLTWIERQIA